MQERVAPQKTREPVELPVAANDNDQDDWPFVPFPDKWWASS